MKVLFISDHFSSPQEPGILRTWQLSRYLGERGDLVSVIAPRNHYLFPRATAGQSHALPRNVRLVAIESTLFDRSKRRSRFRYYGSQLWGTTRAVLHREDCDVIVAGLTPSVLAVGGYLLARARRIPFVLDERDLALDAAAEFGVLPRWLLAIAQGIEGHLHRHSAAVLAVTPGVERVLEGRGVPRERLWLVPNGYDAVAPSDLTPAEVRQALGWGDRVVIIFAGGLGYSYDLNPLLDALPALDDVNLLVAILGEGEGKSDYQERVQAERLPVEFLDPRPKEEMVSICGAADIGVVPLRQTPRSSYVLSNKLFDYLGAGTAVVVSGPGDMADLVREAGAGMVVHAGNPVEMASALRHLVDDPALRRQMGTAGREFVSAHWNRPRFCAVFREALLSVVKGAGLRQESTENEVQRVRQVYGGYDSDPRQRSKRDLSNPGTKAMAETRWAAIEAVLRKRGIASRPTVLDVGCGAGADLRRISDLWDASSPGLYGVDVLPDRIEKARRALPNAHFFLQSGAERLPVPSAFFDVVLASTLFSSILDPQIAARVAEEMLRVVAPKGVIIVYDARYPNPLNPNTRPVGLRMLRALFPACKISALPLTLLPPLARFVGRFAPRLYHPLAGFSPLCSHHVAMIEPIPLADGRDVTYGVTEGPAATPLWVRGGSEK